MVLRVFTHGANRWSRVVCWQLQGQIREKEGEESRATLTEWAYAVSFWGKWSAPFARMDTLQKSAGLKQEEEWKTDDDHNAQSKKKQDKMLGSRRISVFRYDSYACVTRMESTVGAGRVAALLKSSRCSNRIVNYGVHLSR